MHIETHDLRVCPSGIRGFIHEIRISVAAVSGVLSLFLRG